MPITAQYQPPERELPDEEQVPVTCCDLIQMDPRMNKFGKQETPLRFIFLLGGRPMKDGRPFALSMFFNLPMISKRERAFLTSWRGKPYTDAEYAAGIPLEEFAIGRPGLGTVANLPNSKNELWPVFTSLTPLPKAMLRDAPSIKDYVRMKDRPEEGKSVQGMRAALQKRQQEQDEVPF